MKITKIMTAAVALAAMVSCSDELNLNPQSAVKGDADLVATLDVMNDVTTTRLSAVDNGGPKGTEAIVWQPNEKIRVFTLDQLSQDLYQLQSGASTATGQFKQIENNDLTGDKYAITESDMIYGVSADGNSQKPLLTLTLPREYTPGTDANGNQKFPVPFWGPATVSGGSEFSTLSTSVTALTAFLRVNLQELPAGTKYIVLTTHGGGIFKEDEGFMLAPMGTAVTESKDFWYKKSGSDYVFQWITGGYSEALSGTLNATLEEGAELAVDERLVHSDEIIVNLTGVKNQIFYIPIVCNKKDEAGNPIPVQNLHVIAASHVSSKYKYCYAGTELRVFQQQIFKRNKAYYLDMSLVNLGEVCIGELNQAIATYNTTKDITTIFNVDKLHKAAAGSHVGHNDSYIKITGAGNVVLNIKEIGENDGYGETDSKRLRIYDDVWTSNVNGARTAEINVPSDWDFNGDGNPDDAYMDIQLGNYDAILGTVDGLKAAKVDVVANILSGTKFADANTYNLAWPNDQTQILPEKKYALKIMNGFKNMEIAGFGDVYATNSVYAQEETEIDYLYISHDGEMGLRLDDTLVKKLKFQNASVDRLVFTTGSSAIAEVYTYNDKLYQTPATKDNTPSHVVMRSYWTGKALSKYAIESGYDVATVYTTAQLASMGEGLYPDGTNPVISYPGSESNHATTTAPTSGVAPTVAKYNIPTALVRMMWLGAKQHPWIGARVRINGFTLDGENVELKNMNMLTEWPGATTFVDDPHWCCTTCWTPNTEDHKIELGNFFGLMRYIINSDNATVTRVNLNEIQFETDKAINYVGGIAGFVQSPTVDFNNNAVGEVKIDLPGYNIGGMIGYVGATTKLTITNNEIVGLKNNSGYIRGAAYVGGAIGASWAKDQLFQTNTVQLAQDITGTWSCVGGIVGQQYSYTKIDMLSNKVIVKKDIESQNSGNVGGISGRQVANGNINILKNRVTVDNIKAGGDYAGGINGYQLDFKAADILYRDNIVNAKNNIQSNKWAGGIVGYTTTADADNTIKLLSETVTANNIIGTEGMVGGEIGQANQGQFYIGYDDPTGAYDRDYNTTITIKESLAGKYAVGGVIGNNALSMKSPVFINTGASTTMKDGTTPYSTGIKINVNSFVNTKEIKDFAANEQTYFGTMSNIIGYMQDRLTINQDKSTVKNYTYLDITDNLDADMKEKVLYWEHPDQEHNLGINQKYWGDRNGYVGFRATGTYKIGNGKGTFKEVKGEQLDPVALPGHNMFLQVVDKDKKKGDYYKVKSKYQL